MERKKATTNYRLFGGQTWASVWNGVSASFSVVAQREIITGCCRLCTQPGHRVLWTWWSSVAAAYVAKDSIWWLFRAGSADLSLIPAPTAHLQKRPNQIPGSEVEMRECSKVSSIFPGWRTLIKVTSIWKLKSLVILWPRGLHNGFLVFQMFLASKAQLCSPHMQSLNLSKRQLWVLGYQGLQSKEHELTFLPRQRMTIETHEEEGGRFCRIKFPMFHLK